MVTIVGHRSRFGSIISSSASGGGYDMILYDGSYDSICAGSGGCYIGCW